VVMPQRKSPEGRQKQDLGGTLARSAEAGPDLQTSKTAVPPISCQYGEITRSHLSPCSPRQYKVTIHDPFSLFKML
jgi:hypothetical protein